ncbi:MAG: MupG family TIM beta-alpha barrel fold protein [Erysipelotrichaceae bacterium]|nr:MupG family TIM beta-alpha barrel fold protein [Erysipelotrichaceae bacterium]
MKQLGISIYPAHSNLQEDYAYLKKASNLGYRRLFMCLLSEESSAEDIVKKYQELCAYAHSLGFQISVDTNYDVFKKLKASPFDLSIFHTMRFDIIRLDGPFTDYDYVVMTNNPYQLIIEFNGASYLDFPYLLKLGANRDQMAVCANFYPCRYTGLSLELYRSFTNSFRSLGFRNAAFVSSNEKHTFGPWPVYEGLVTLEMHRDMDLVDQARHLLATGLVDDIIIGNCYASEEELTRLANLDMHKVYFKLKEEVMDEASAFIVYKALHFRRMDCGDYMIRSSYPRSLKDIDIKPVTCTKKEFTYGDVLLVNGNSSHYQRELHIVVKPMKNDGTRNLVGSLSEFEMELVTLLKDNQIFTFEREV